MVQHYYTILLFYTLISLVKTHEISFRDPNIQYFGRWHTSPNEIQSGWPGAYFKVTVEYTRSIKLQLNKPTFITAHINKGPQLVFKNTSTCIDLIPEGLETDGPHELLVVASNVVDPSQMSIGLESILVDDTGSTVTPPPSASTPLVEFVGHDLTLGIASSQTLFSSFAWLTSELLGLEHSQIAYKDATLIDGMEYKYFDWSLLGDHDQQQEQMETKTPWSVVILLGANDHETDYASNEYRQVLNSFLTRIRERLYENAPIFILSEPLGDMYRPSQQSVIDRVHQGDQHIYFIDTTAWLRYGSNLYKDRVGVLCYMVTCVFLNSLFLLLLLLLLGSFNRCWPCFNG
jgi:hypothetical protein